MKLRSLLTLLALTLITFSSCSQNTLNKEHKTNEEPKGPYELKQEPHRYGGWYCPDNLFGFPAVDIKDWNKVPVVNGRMATEEETRNGSALILVDMDKYPKAKPLDIEMPKLARYYSNSSNKEELVIIIQALNITNDSIVGFRFLNGGNGSARLNEVSILSENEISKLPTSRFVSLKLDIEAPKAKIWDALTGPTHAKELQAIFDSKNTFGEAWIDKTKVNFKYANAGNITSAFAGDLYGNQYIQIDCELDDYQYVEKFMVTFNNETNTSELIITCGPYADDFDAQEEILIAWSQKVKELSEGK